MLKMLTYAFILILTNHLVKGAVILPDPLKLYNDVELLEKYESPVVITNGGTTIIYPNKNNGVEINLAVGTVVDIACLRGALKFTNATSDIFGSTSLESISAIYLFNQQFEIDNYIVSLEDVVCYEASATYNEFTGNRCGDGNVGYEAEIGFTLSTSTVKTKTITVCFDETLQTPIFNYHVLTSKSKQTSSEHNWKQGTGFYNLPAKVDDLYKNSAQTITNILNLVPNYILTKGHLAPVADFETAAAQSTTYHYINAAPQWDTLNNVNWNNIENSIRQYGLSKLIDLKVWTGIHGVVTLNDAAGTPQNLYLYPTSNQEALPVPKFFWKVVYYEAENKGVAFVGVNDPITPPLICNDVWTLYDWLPVNRNTDGYVYACLVEDLHGAIPHAPDLQNVDLLLIN